MTPGQKLVGSPNEKSAVQQDAIKRIETMLKGLSEQNRLLVVALNGQMSDQQKQMDQLCSIDKKMSELQSAIVQLDKRTIATMHSTSSHPVQTSQSNHLSCRYVRPYRDGILVECKESDASYKLTLTSERDASFEFCGNIERAINNYDAVLKQYCELEGDRVSFSQYAKLSNGKVELREQGYWQVTFKLKMKLL